MSIDLETLKIDDDGDLVMDTLEDGGESFREVSGIEAVEQRLYIRLGTVLGEDMFDRRVGLPLSTMMGILDQDYVEGVIRAELKKDRYLIEVT